MDYDWNVTQTMSAVAMNVTGDPNVDVKTQTMATFSYSKENSELVRMTVANNTPWDIDLTCFVNALWGMESSNSSGSVRMSSNGTAFLITIMNQGIGAVIGVTHDEMKSFCTEVLKVENEEQ